MSKATNSEVSVMRESLKVIPPGYEPEPWDVVRSDGQVIVHAAPIAVADDQCCYLNSKSTRGVHYSVVPTP